MAGGGLLGLQQNDGLETVYRKPESLACIEHFDELIAFYLPGFPGDLSGRLAKRVTPIVRDRGADDAFPADDAGLDQIAVLHHGEQRHHAAERKVDVLDRSCRRVQHPTPPPPFAFLILALGVANPPPPAPSQTSFPPPRLPFSPP